MYIMFCRGKLKYKEDTTWIDSALHRSDDERQRRREKATEDTYEIERIDEVTAQFMS